MVDLSFGKHGCYYNGYMEELYHKRTEDFETIDGFDFLIYKAADEEVSVNAVIKDDTIWLTQKSMSELFEIDRSVINKHLKNIYESGELVESSTYAKFAQVQNEGSRQVKRSIDFYNFDAIISVGYRVNSKRATHFRQWATGVSLYKSFTYILS